MPGIEWQKLRVPLMERLALADMAGRCGKSEDELLAEIIRAAVKTELAEKSSREERNTLPLEAAIERH
jgi:hypothetical protein